MKQLLSGFLNLSKNRYAFILIGFFIFIASVCSAFKKNDSRAGYVDTPVAFTAPLKGYQSTINWAVADQKNQNDISKNRLFLTPTIYAKIFTYQSTLTQTDAYYDVYVKFYSDAACTQEYSVNDLNFNYTATQKNCEGYVIGSSSYSEVCTGSEIFLGTMIWSRESDEECWYYEYASAPGTGYVAE